MSVVIYLTNADMWRMFGMAVAPKKDEDMERYALSIMTWDVWE